MLLSTLGVRSFFGAMKPELMSFRGETFVGSRMVPAGGMVGVSLRPCEPGRFAGIVPEL